MCPMRQCGGSICGLPARYRKVLTSMFYLYTTLRQREKPERLKIKNCFMLVKVYEIIYNKDMHIL